ncbi:MAG: hypothetical protein MR673_06985 [Fusobacterium perfoetens]|uniref:hypothetical protein n=1 Tax=Fusobacterium perfoetens TaxID=852 RepID=UPI0023F424CA|nr:hypothetical protein [Fusobacterium perfoetens]MCI6152854.1 hypothetical protein [Fusobacterium perfoetens]MDY3237264.1 hypothetical protein [Fusobacterium perfoetens]
MLGGSFARTNGETLELIVGIFSIISFYFLFFYLIRKKIKSTFLQKIFLISIAIQLIILIIDNYIYTFPLIDMDAISFEREAWESYIYKKNLGLTAYNTLFLNYIYKLIQVRVPVIFSLINILFSVLSGFNLLEILKKLEVDYKKIKLIMFIYLLSPLSLIFKTGILREAIIIYFVSLSLKKFIDYHLEKRNINFFKACFYLIIATIFHSGVSFIGVGYGYYFFFRNKGIYKISAFILIGLLLIFSYYFKDILLGNKIGTKNILEAIINKQNNSVLKGAGSAYLINISPQNLSDTIKYLPLRIFYFLYSPTPDIFRGSLDILTFLFNSTIYIFLTWKIIVKKFFCKKNKKDKLLGNSLILGLIVALIVFSIGTQNTGTAIRHRDKILILITIIYGTLIKKEGKNE